MNFREKPSRFLARYRLMTKDITIDEMQRWFVFRSLPEAIQLTLLNDPSASTADGLAKAADKLMPTVEKEKSVELVAAVEKTPQAVKVVDKDASKSKEQFNLCYFHRKFGSNATRCGGSVKKKCPMWSRQIRPGVPGNADGEQ